MPLFKSAEAINRLLHNGGKISASLGLWQKRAGRARRRHIKLNAYPVEKTNVINVLKEGWWKFLSGITEERRQYADLKMK